MQYAVWIALAVVFIAIGPALIGRSKDKAAGPRDGSSTSGGSTDSSSGFMPIGVPVSSDSDATCAPDASSDSWGDSCDAGGDSGGGDGGGGGD